MPVPESLTTVRTRIGCRLAEIESRVARRKPVNMSARMAAIRTLAADHGLTSLAVAIH